MRWSACSRRGRTSSSTTCSESGVYPLTPRELLGDDAEGLLDRPLVYTQSNGTIELRSLVSALYPESSVDQVQVTNGGSEANYIVLWRLVEPGDEVAMLVPNYMQTFGLAKAFGGTVREWPLVEDRGAGRWRPDIEQLRHVVSNRTKLIVVCTPNNPTGARLTPQELDEIAHIAGRHGSWVLSDEVYRGAELMAASRHRSGAATIARLSPAVCRKRTACRGCASVGSLGHRHSSPRPGRTTTTSRSPPVR